MTPAAEVLAHLAAELYEARQAITGALCAQDVNAAFVALRAIELAGYTADRAAAALGATPVQAGDEWLLGGRVREALAALERARDA